MPCKSERVAVGGKGVFEDCSRKMNNKSFYWTIVEDDTDNVKNSFSESVWRIDGICE